MEYIYCLANASLTLRIIEYLHNHPQIPIDFVTVINLIDGWLIRIKVESFSSLKLAANFRAFLNEMGVSHKPSLRVDLTLQSLAAGDSPTKVMSRYQVVVVSHGKPEQEEIEAFREQIIERLGYCPQNMA